MVKEASCGKGSSCMSSFFEEGLHRVGAARSLFSLALFSCRGDPYGSWMGQRKGVSHLHSTFMRSCAVRLRVRIKRNGIRLAIAIFTS